jgi:uroporphyrinogen III methyltransferase / synthase
VPEKAASELRPRRGSERTDYARGEAASLSGTVVLTRQPEDNGALASALRERGAHVIELPCVRTAPLGDRGDLASILDALRPDDLLVLTSRAGVDAVTATRSRVPCAVAAVGESTARRAEKRGMRIAFVASRADGRTLGRELPLPVGTTFLARSDLADGDLPEILRTRGATVREVAAYRTIAEIDGDPSELVCAIERGPVTIVVASPSAVDALASIGTGALRRAAFVAIGPRTARRVRERLGLDAVIADAPDTAAIVRAIRLHREEIHP